MLPDNDLSCYSTMNDAIVKELSHLFSILTQCVGSFREDFNKINCKKPDTVVPDLIPSLVFKLQKIAECARSLQKIAQSLKKSQFQCLPCLTNSSVDKKSPP